MTHNIIKTKNYLLAVSDEIHVGHLLLNNSPVLEGVPLLPPLEDEQSLQQPKMPVAFECEWTTKQMPEFHQDEPKTTTNPQGQTVLVGKYIY